MEMTAASVFGDVLVANAQLYPDKPAFISSTGAELSFSNFNLRINRLNNAMVALGVKHGDRVAILAHNCVEYMEVYGLGKTGLIVVALNWRLVADDLVMLIGHSSPVVLIAEERYADLLETLRGRLGCVRQFVIIGAGRNGWTSYESLLASASSEEPRVGVSPEDVLALIYTSGTTGTPKGVAVTHRSVLDNARAIAHELLSLNCSDVSLSVMPLFHSGGMWYYTFPSHATGCTVALLPEFDAERVIASLERYRVTTIHVVPTMLAALVNHPRIAAAELSALRLVFYAASSMPVALLLQAMDVLQRSQFVQSYGSTEAGVVTGLTAADHLLARESAKEYLLSSCGRAFMRREICILDEDGVAQAPGILGEIGVHTPGMMQDYWPDTAATQRVLTGAGWLRMGDIAYMDPAGYVYIVDRKNDMIVTGGENVYPSEVESALYRDPDVAEATVFGVPDPRWVERVVAAVVLCRANATTAPELIARLRTQLAGYKCPKEIYLVDNLPKNGAGKVLRKALRDQYGSLRSVPPPS